MNKTAIRSLTLNQRKNLNPNQIADLSKKIVNYILASELYLQAQNIALYLPFGGEVDLTALLHSHGKQFYLPSIKQKQMQFHLYKEDLMLDLHPYGIQQPKFMPSLKPAQLDLCLMPLVAFDLHGNRLGMGGGFYDRYFEHNRLTELAGVGYQFQQQNKLPAHSWDVKINHIFTEQGHFKL